MLGALWLPAQMVWSAPSPDPKVDWPGWRGPGGDGIAAPGQQLPVRWDEGSGVVWKAPLPGRGHGSPTVVGAHIYLATAEPSTGAQSVLCLERATGKQLWQREVHAAQADAGRHANSSAASSTVACDGERLYINFPNSGAVYTSALSLDGALLWQTKLCDFVMHQGFASSPMVHGDLVLVTADHRGGGLVAGLDRKNGKIVWSRERPKIANYPSPSVLRAASRTQLVLGGCNLVTSLDPVTGQKLWELEGSTEETVGSAVTDGTRIFVSGGWPKNHTMAVTADGSGAVAWQNTARVYVPSMLVKDGYLYAVMDAGMAVCWKADSGEQMWKERLGGDFFASPVMAGDRVYATNLAGETFVFEATPQSFKLLSQNKLGTEAYASPVLCGNRIYLRTAYRSESRSEFLFCIGAPASEPPKQQ
jgi:outer membrane protein assembly factor BamB